MFIDPSGHIGIMPDGSIYMVDGDMEIDKQLVQLKQQYSNATSDSERQRLAGEAKTLRDNNPGKWHVSSDKSLDYYTIPDVTEKLNDLMSSNREEFEKHRGNFIWFKNNVGYNCLFDIKTQSEWQHEHVIYNGQVLRGDVPGNISYGYLGKAAHFSDFTLRVAAGIAQQFSNAGQPVDRTWIFTNWGDAPGDWEFIKIGIEQWKKDVNYKWWNINPLDRNGNYGWF